MAKDLGLDRFKTNPWLPTTFEDKLRNAHSEGWLSASPALRWPRPKAEKPSVSQLASDFVKHLRQVSEINKDIGGDREIERVGFCVQDLDQFAAEQIIVDLTLPRDLEHIRGISTPVKRLGERMKEGSEDPSHHPIENVRLRRRGSNA